MEGRPEAREALARAARVLRERLLLERSHGWEVPVALPRDPVLPPAPAPPDLEAERARRLALLEPIDREVRACRACVLCERRSRTVFGVGDPCARLMFVGEGPGEDEDRQGEPFVGPAGQLLDRMIRAMGLLREQVYIANIVKCHPPGNRNPEPREIVACLPYLRRQLAVIAPEVICCLGKVATQALLGTTLSISRLRGKFAEYEGVPVLPTFHPAYLLRNPADKRLVWEDLKKVMERLRLPPPAPPPSIRPGGRPPPARPVTPPSPPPPLRPSESPPS